MFEGPEKKFQRHIADYFIREHQYALLEQDEILAHNHPAGALTPSEQDIETTQRLQQAGEIMGITVLDHIIFNRTEYFSFLESDIGF